MEERMIEQYIDEKNYQAALELLTDSTDEMVRYLRLVCLFGLKEFEQAKYETKKAKALATDTYYEVVSMQISILKELAYYDEAIDILVEELSMPYIPEPYGSLLNLAYDDILIEKQENKDLRYQTKTIYSDEEFHILLTKDTTQEVMVSVLEQLRNYNVRRLLPEIKDFLLNINRDSVLKSVLIEIMIEQEIDEEMEVYKQKEYIPFNPSNLPFVLESEVYQEASKLLIEVLENDNPSLLQLSIEFLEMFLYHHYPKELYDMEITLLSASVHYYIATMQGISIDVEELSYLYQCEKEAVISSVLAFEQLEC